MMTKWFKNAVVDPDTEKHMISLTVHFKCFSDIG